MNVGNINVVKRDGSVAPFDIEKIHKMVELACENITGVSVSDIEMEAHLSFYDGITSRDIHGAITKSAANLISDQTPNYQYVAGRLLTFDIRKTAWGGMNPPRLFDHVRCKVEEGYYTPELLSLYSEEDWNNLDSVIDHDRDLRMTHIAVKEYLTKYSIRDRSQNDVIPQETPQFTYILIAALMCSDTCLVKDVKSYYNDVSFGNFSLPTPIMAGMRSTTKQFSSCVLIECDDTLKSIEHTNMAVQEYVSKKAGIGVGMSGVRSEGSSVANRTIKHTGVVPYFRQLQGTVKSCSQGGVRGGAATVHCLLWHPEIQNILVLKNNKGTQDNRVRQLDYSILINNFMYKRLIENGHINLFSPNDVPDMYEAYFDDPAEFERLYVKYEKKPELIRGKITAAELFSNTMLERKDTGRIYIMNIDNVNDHSSFIDSVRMSNLCQEITLITTPMATKKSYEIYVPNDQLLKVINQLGTSDVVDKFEIQGI
jgi:ribonucleoside-diphosphate reductase alpha chain